MTVRLLVVCVLLVGVGDVFQSALMAAEKAKASPQEIVSGREIFVREWLPNDPRSHGGDGLGPVFNESSCVACHNQGGVAGAGPEGKNVTVISAVRVPTQKQLQELREMQAAQHQRSQNSFDQQGLAGVLQFLGNMQQATSTTVKPKPLSEEERKTLLAELKKLHPGLATTRSVVLHRSSTENNYTEWRQRLLLGAEMFEQLIEISGSGLPPRPPQMQQANSQQIGALIAQALLQEVTPRDLALEKLDSVADTFMSHPTFRAQLGAQAFRGNNSNKPQFITQASQRNTTSLFGVGLIDSIPDSVIEAAAANSDPNYPMATGRVARLKDGKIGRFGWKAQKASLYDFTMTACAVELGLHVPDHPQAGSPHRPDYQPAGFDLNQRECDELVRFLKDLPAPTTLGSDNAAVRDALQTGERMFAKVGCAACHTPQLGEVAGIYSDLLLHDMGPDSGDSGSYGVFVPDSKPSDSEDPIPELTALPLENFNRGMGLGRTTAQTLQSVPDDFKGASSQEWRTPPLWGVRDSAPYMHDGRAKSLEQAIAMHGGEGHASAVRFFQLSKPEQSRVLAFLRTLVAPDAIASSK